MNNLHQDIASALECLNSGGIILYPTDTIWGLGCDATNPEAVKRIYELKQRCDAQSMLVLVNRDGMIPQYVDEVPEMAWMLIEVADKPLTIIYPGAKNLAPNLLAKDGSVGIRITSEEFTYKLLERFKRPIVSTSANISGTPSPTNFTEISNHIKENVDYIVNFRQDDMEKKTPSGIIKLDTSNQVTIIRE